MEITWTVNKAAFYQALNDKVYDLKRTITLMHRVMRNDSDMADVFHPIVNNLNNDIQVLSEVIVDFSGTLSDYSLRRLVMAGVMIKSLGKVEKRVEK